MTFTSHEAAQLDSAIALARRSVNVNYWVEQCIKVLAAWREAEARLSTTQNYQQHRQYILNDLARRGFKDGELQLLWRTTLRPYEPGEVVAAICDALTREGCTAWNGDGTSCVEQMVGFQYRRAENAEAERDALRASHARLVEALRPFAENAARWDSVLGSEPISHYRRDSITVGDLRCAQAALAEAARLREPSP